jgi:hypothetical protein
MLRHVLPNTMGPVLVIATINLGSRSSPRRRCRSSASACRRHQPSLGTLIRIGNNYLFSGEWWITAFPGVALAADGAVDQSARRLAARRAQSAAALMPLLDVEAVLSVRNLQVEFPTRRGTLRALDACLRHRKGEVLGVVGESGAASR